MIDKAIIFTNDNKIVMLLQKWTYDPLLHREVSSNCRSSRVGVGLDLVMSPLHLNREARISGVCIVENGM